MGYADVVKLVVRKQKKYTDSRFVIDAAARGGHLDIVKFLVESKVYLDAPYVINYAAAHGHLEVVEYLDTHISEGCTMQAMTDAAANGYLDVVRYLHENRTEGCFYYTLSQAVHNGHLEVVKYLRNHYPQLKCSSFAFDKVASRGNLELINFLHESFGNLTFTANALTSAVKNGHVDVVAFLCEHHSEGDVPELLEIAAKHGHLKIVKLLHSKLRADESAFGALEVTSRWYRRQIVEFLCENESREASSFLQQAVEIDCVGVVKVLLPHSSLTQLVMARDHAVKRGRADIVDLLTRVIEGSSHGESARHDEE